MRTMLLFLPILLVGGYALHRLGHEAHAGQAEPQEHSAECAECGADRSCAQWGSNHVSVEPTHTNDDPPREEVTTVPSVDIRVLQDALHRAELSELDLNLRAAAHADVSASLEGLLQLVTEHIERAAEEGELDAAAFAVTGDLLAQVAASLGVSIAVDTSGTDRR